MRNTDNTCYVYAHIRTDTNEIFYIGIGSTSNYKRAYSIYDRNRFWKRIVNKSSFTVKILFNSLSWTKACKKEIRFIKLIGRRDLQLGSLVNLTDGGEGSNNMSLKGRKGVSNSLKLRDRKYAYKSIYILDLKLNIIKTVKNAKEASLFLYGSENYSKKIRTYCNCGFKINKEFFVIKVEDFYKKDTILRVTRKQGKPSCGNKKSFTFNGIFYDTKKKLQKELNLNENKFNSYFAANLKENKIKFIQKEL